VENTLSLFPFPEFLPPFFFLPLHSDSAQGGSTNCTTRLFFPFSFPFVLYSWPPPPPFPFFHPGQKSPQDRREYLDNRATCLFLCPSRALPFSFFPFPRLTALLTRNRRKKNEDNVFPFLLQMFFFSLPFLIDPSL